MATTGRAKTTLACDRCRRRKSRCDGIRPNCTHCVTARVECSYRPTPTNLETDVSVLSRLSEAESRIRYLEAQCTDIQSRAPKSLVNGRTSSNGPIRENNLLALASPPVLHTASAHQMLHSWPRIRLCITLPDFQPLTFLSASDAAEPFLPESTKNQQSPPPLGAWQVLEAVEDFYSGMHKLPIAWALLFELHGEFQRSRVLEGLLSSDHESVIEPSSLSISQLLVLSMALKNQEKPSDVNYTAAAATYFGIVLGRHWTLLAASMDRVVLSLAIAYCLIHDWMRPFHALGMLQSIALTLKRMSIRCQNERALLHCSLLYFILEGDILTELDESSADTTLSAGDSPINEVISSLTNSGLNLDEECRSLSLATQVLDHVWLRCHLNKILHLYTPEKAYARPHELVDLVYQLSSELHQWYLSRPLNGQFPRDLMAFSLSNRDLQLRIRELAVRYLSCVFFTHRPVLYFYLHKDMEYSIRSPNLIVDTASDHQPWVMDSCRACIESALFIIHLCTSSAGDTIEQSRRHWCEYQLLFATYLVILQAKGMQVFEPLLRTVDGVEALLDRVEGVFHAKAAFSLKLEQSLSILQNARQNFEASSPTYSR